MAYHYSTLDNSLSSWFIHDMNHCLLRSINLISGKIRGLNPFNVVFEYPIAAIAGKNGSGKSTILALAACAYHSDSKNNPLIHRNYSYYTFSDFLIQSEGEIPPNGIQISYGIAHNDWRVTESNSIKEGVLYQLRTKPHGGKWNDYDRRVKRQVVFFGIDRVVPHSEKSISKSYRRQFSKVEKEGWEEKVRDCVGYVLGANYEDFEYKKHSKYRLPFVKRQGESYSGFNMGAGENALFEIFSIIHTAKNGALFVIDEIELGLHEQAQKRLIHKLKDVCNEKKIQIICTTHSPAILKSLPPVARFFVESLESKTNVISGISPAYATGKLSGENSRELDIYVEDSLAKTILLSSLEHSIRGRIQIIDIGSHAAVINQFVGRKLHPTGLSIICLDGDQRTEHNKHRKLFINRLEPSSADEKEEYGNWFDSNSCYLPGDTSPEQWLINICLTEPASSKLAESLGLENDELLNSLQDAVCASKHDEFRTLANSVHLQEEVVVQKVADIVTKVVHQPFDEIKIKIVSMLDGNAQ
jgi:predicted ATPase